LNTTAQDIREGGIEPLLWCCILQMRERTPIVQQFLCLLFTYRHGLGQTEPSCTRSWLWMDLHACTKSAEVDGGGWIWHFSSSLVLFFVIFYLIKRGSAGSMFMSGCKYLVVCRFPVRHCGTAALFIVWRGEGREGNFGKRKMVFVSFFLVCFVCAQTSTCIWFSITG